ncbi:unnamed protein product [Ixodes persulcatus]
MSVIRIAYVASISGTPVECSTTSEQSAHSPPSSASLMQRHQLDDHLSQI